MLSCYGVVVFCVMVINFGVVCYFWVVYGVVCFGVLVVDFCVGIVNY